MSLPLPKSARSASLASPSLGRLLADLLLVALGGHSGQSAALACRRSQRGQSAGSVCVGLAMRHGRWPSTGLVVGRGCGVLRFSDLI